MFEVKKENNITTIALPENLGTVISKEMEPKLTDEIDSVDGKLIFDFKGVKFICSYFIRLFLKAYKKVGGENFQVVNVGPEVKKVLKIAGFDKFLKL